ncbi:MAG: MT-A70 family methyltransferase [Nanoarchaeota archaeon]
MIKKIAKDYKKYIESMNEKDFVIIDPPWIFNNKSKALNSLTDFAKLTDNVEFLNYLFKNIKTKILFVWITAPILGYFFDKRFNVDFDKFEYKQFITWNKTTTAGNDYEGQGFWFKNACEYLVLFTTKKAKPIKSRILNICREAAIKNTLTQKPKEYESFLFRELYNSNYLNGAYIFSGSFIDYDISGKQALELVDICFKNETSK